MITRRRRKRLGIVDTNRTTNTAKRAQTNPNTNNANASTIVNTNRAKSVANNDMAVSVQPAAACPSECENFLNKPSIDPKSYSKQNSNYLSVANHTKRTPYIVEQTTSAINPRQEAVTQLTSHFQSQHHASKVSRTAGMNITIMLIAVVFLFFVCQFPTLVLHIIQGLICTEVETVCASALYQYGVVVSKFLLVCNLTFNFACYCFFSAKFRQVLVEIFSVYQYELKNQVNMNRNQTNQACAKSAHNQLKTANSQQFSPEKQKFIEPVGV
jgi:hypothetical protein